MQQEAGVHTMISVSVDPESALNGLDLSRDYDCIFPTVGIHPLYHEAFDQIAAIERLITSEPSFVAVGEIGLDYHYGERYKQEQETGFSCN